MEQRFESHPHGGVSKSTATHCAAIKGAVRGEHFFTEGRPDIFDGGSAGRRQLVRDGIGIHDHGAMHGEARCCRTLAATDTAGEPDH
jgi:hypothetical protein